MAAEGGWILTLNFNCVFIVLIGLRFLHSSVCFSGLTMLVVEKNCAAFCMVCSSCSSSSNI